MKRLTNSGTKEAKINVTIREVLDKLATYEDLEESLQELFQNDEYSFSDVLDTIKRILTEPGKKHPVYARILTYEDADEWDKYKKDKLAKLKI